MPEVGVDNAEDLILDNDDIILDDEDEVEIIDDVDVLKVSARKIRCVCI